MQVVYRNNIIDVKKGTKVVDLLKNEIEKIPAHEAISTVITQTLRTNDMYEMEKMLTLSDKLLTSVPFYRLKCNMEKEAADVSYEGMKGVNPYVF